MAGPGDNEDYAGALGYVLDQFEAASTDRWQQTIHDAVVSSGYIPPALHIYKQSHYAPVYDHRRAEVYAHAVSGNCTALAWYDGGRAGGVPTSCPGLVWSSESGSQTVFWPPTADGASVEVPETIDCGVGLLLAQAEEWAYQDRTYIFDRLPKFADQKLSSLRAARDALVGMAGDLGGEAEQGDPALRTSLTLVDEVNGLFGDRHEGTDWRADWTGTAADRASEGFFASTSPTLYNHALMANGLSILVNERATIIDTYRNNSINLVQAATAALGAQSETSSETDLTGVWKAVNRINTVVGWLPQAKVATRVITIVAWLGDDFLGKVAKTEFTYDHDPGAVAIALYDQVVDMVGTLTTAEEGYTEDVATFRAAVNAVPSTFLELYDLTENSATGAY
ncbi:hypothetical protein [Actinophytocola glycyrrhizae]|uniref:Uncharacterized protein n=1 Tax=Actinophytocola glycyrrhizae TaxID=2044873 RepID=A0ABV9RZL9_9PSEU